MNVPYVDLAGQHAELRPVLTEALHRVLDHGQFILGPEVEELESRWADLCGTRHAVGVSDGTTALILTLRALGVNPGDEVITAPNSFVASAGCIVQSGALPRFVDIGDDLNLDPACLEDAVNPRTRAVIAVHLTGRPADMDALNRVAERHGLVVLEDAAQAMGARYQGRPVGGLAKAACFSLHPLKTLGSLGDGGMITTNDDALADRLRLVRNHGIRHRQEDCATWGVNARLDTLQAAFVLAKLSHLNEWIERRRAIAQTYRTRLDRWARMPVDRPGDRPVYQTFPIQVERRDELVAYLNARGVGSAVHYRLPIHRLPVARSLGYPPGSFPHAERHAERGLSLPIYPSMTDAQIEHACTVIEDFFHGSGTMPMGRNDAKVLGDERPIPIRPAQVIGSPACGTGSVTVSR